MRITRHQVWGGILLLIGVGMTVYLGVLSGAEKQPSRATSALLVVLSAVFQFASAAQFNRIGKADPGLARAAVRRLFRMATRAKEIRHVAEMAYEVGNSAETKKVMGRISAELSWIEEGIVDSIEDWQEFHKDALRELGEGRDGGEQN